MSVEGLDHGEPDFEVFKGWGPEVASQHADAGTEGRYPTPEIVYEIDDEGNPVIDTQERI